MRNIVFSALLLSLMICQCGSLIGKEIKTRTIWESGSGYIRLFHEVGGNKGFNQPIHFHEKDMKQILLSIYYSRYQFFRWNTASRVFEETQARKLARFFQKAFLKAGPDDIVEFYLPFRSKKLLGVSGHSFLTRGRAFVIGEKLHFEFSNVQHSRKSYSTHSEDQKAFPPMAWKLIPQKGQAYGMIAGMANFENENPHWLTINLNQASLPHPSAEATPAASSPPPAEDRGSEKQAREEEAIAPQQAPLSETKKARKTKAREKLRELKTMQEEGLINQKDYNRKKEEILNSF